MTGIFIVKQLGTVQSFESRKNPGQSVTCADAVLREMGSPDYADSFKVRLFGRHATNLPHQPQSINLMDVKLHISDEDYERLSAGKKRVAGSLQRVDGKFLR